MHESWQLVHNRKFVRHSLAVESAQFAHSVQTSGVQSLSPPTANILEEKSNPKHTINLEIIFISIPFKVDKVPNQNIE